MIEKVECKQKGGCHNCIDNDIDLKTHEVIYKQNEIASILLGRTRIRLCDDCLRKLQKSIDEYFKN